MANPTGFLEIKERELPELRDVAERLADFADTHVGVETRAEMELASPQASRCMDCGVPFCHFSCPLGNLIPEWNDLAWQEKWQDAFERLSITNNFPEFTGRLCPALCEAGCVLGSIDPAVTIKNIEVTISDVAWRREYCKPQPAERVSGKTVAVVGSGPAGLAAAQQLARVGHTVVVFEKDEQVGGLLRFGIPNFKMEKWIIDRRMKQLEAEGVRFRCGIEVGGTAENDISLEELHQRFDAVLIATGASVPNDLPIEGRGLEGIHFAMDFLPNATRTVLGLDPKGEAISAEGKNVLIIGGGDTGSDCLGTSLRQGAKMVTTLQVLPEPPATRADSKAAGYPEQPWPTYPMLNTKSSSIEEGETAGKSEVLFETTAVRFKGGEGDENGRVKTATLAKVQRDENGRFVPIKGTEYDIPVDLVLISVGFRGPETDRLFSGLKTPPALTSRTAIERDLEFQTSLSRVFVAGDAGRGQSLIVWAIAEGRAAAAAIDKFLMGSTELPAPITPTTEPLRA